jgi:putative protease
VDDPASTTEGRLYNLQGVGNGQFERGGPERGAAGEEKMPSGERIGEVTHYYDRASVAVLKLTQDLKLGEELHFLGKNSDFEQKVTSMQIEHQAVTEVRAGQEVAVQVKQKVRPGDSVFRIMAED